MNTDETVTTNNEELIAAEENAVLAADAQVHAEELGANEEGEALVDVAAVEGEDSALLENSNLITDEPEISRALEAVIFASPKAISLKRIKNILTSFNYDTRPVTEILDGMIASTFDKGFQLVKVAGAYQFRTNPAQSDILQKLLEDKPVRLSASALEVLAIITYKQPVSRSEIDAVRGVDSSHLTRGLLDKNLIRTVGHAETPGRPLLFGTTPYFLEVFTLDSLDAMPSLEEYDRELANQKNSVGSEDEEGSEESSDVDVAALEEAALFHDHDSPLAANPDRGNFDEPAQDEVEAPDFGLKERALEGDV